MDDTIQSNIDQLSENVHMMISLLVQLGICTQQEVEDTRNRIFQEITSKGGGYSG